MLLYQIALNASFMTYEQYSQLSGMPKCTIMDWVAEGKLLIKTKGKAKETPMINMVALHEMATREALQLLWSYSCDFPP
ncbi:MAG: hypothetical protein ACRC7J_18100 [Vibrio ordalii]|uniref:hypothetical protein n=1 Tax=Vibrio ordalii TaxID=28174 RepID=UPI003F352618